MIKPENKYYSSNNKHYLITSLIILSSIILFSACSSPQVGDVETYSDPNLYVGEFEICENNILRLECMEGLIRFELTTTPYTIAICLSENYTLDDNFYIRYKDIIDENSYNELIKKNLNLKNIKTNSSTLI